MFKTIVILLITQQIFSKSIYHFQEKLQHNSHNSVKCLKYYSDKCQNIKRNCDREEEQKISKACENSLLNLNINC